MGLAHVDNGSDLARSSGDPITGSITNLLAYQVTNPVCYTP